MLPGQQRTSILQPAFPETPESRGYRDFRSNRNRRTRRSIVGLPYLVQSFRSTGICIGAPLSLTKKAMNLADLVLLAFRPIT
jgi:hypothetical protein